MTDHYEQAENLLRSASPFDAVSLAMVHAILAVADRLEELPMVAMHLHEVEDEEDE